MISTQCKQCEGDWKQKKETNVSNLANQYKGSYDIFRGIHIVTKYHLGEPAEGVELNCLNIFIKDEFYSIYVDTTKMTTKEADSLWNVITKYILNQGYPKPHLTFDYPIGDPDED